MSILVMYEFHDVHDLIFRDHDSILASLTAIDREKVLQSAAPNKSFPGIDTTAEFAL